MGDIAESHQLPSPSRTWSRLSLILLAVGTLATTFVVNAGAGGEALRPGWRPIPVVYRGAPSASGGSGVDIAVSPSARTVVVGESFTMAVVVDPNEVPVDTVHADVTFDPAMLQVTSVTGHSSGLDLEVINAFDNGAGTLTHRRESSSGDPTASPFTLCTIVFDAVGVTEGTTLSFTEDTDAYLQGTSVLGSTSGATVVVEEPATPTTAPSATTTLTPSVTATPSITLTPSVTPTPSITPTPSSTPTPARTATSTASPTPFPTTTVEPTSTMTPTPTPSTVATETRPADGQRLYLPVVLRR